MSRQYPPIVRRVGNEKDHDVDAAVALLQGDSPFERLEIPEPCLRFECDRPAVKGKDRVPGPVIARHRQRDLGPPASGLRQLPPQPSEQAKLRRVTNRVSVGVRPGDEPEPDCGSCAGELVDGDIDELRPLDPPELCM